MSYLVLARKYRPRTFTEVAGQQTAMRTLENAIREDRVGHAYLFCGSRGTGKTTTARILAKALLCERGPTPDPCGECGHCRDVEAGRHVDVTEIDAASNRGIDAVRELRDGVGYAPMRARYRIYIVDEVHQITKEGFNAFLKTLEEPPAHVKFFFATTEVDKVIETVRSRCQIVRLTLIAEATIAARLEEVLAKEGVQPGPGVTAELAKLARGSMRDALTLTDQLIALVGANPVATDVQRVAPHSSEERALELWDALERGDSAAALRCLPRADGGEVELCTALLEALRLALVCVLCSADAALFEADPERRARLVERAKRLGAERTQLWLEELLHARERMALLPRHARIVLEVTLLDLARPAHTMPIAQLEQRLVALEARLAQGGATSARGALPSAAPSAAPTAPGTQRASSREPSSAARGETGEIPAPAPSVSPDSAPLTDASRAPAPLPTSAVEPRASNPAASVAPVAAAPAPPAAEKPPASPPVSASSGTLSGTRSTTSGAPSATSAFPPRPASAAPAPGAAPRPPIGSLGNGAAAGAVPRPLVATPTPAATPAAPPRGAAPAPTAWRPSAGRPLPTKGAPAAAHAASWSATLEALGRTHDSLAGVLSRCGSLADLGASRAVVRVVRPSENERTLLAERSSVSALAAALSHAVGRTIDVVIDDPAQRPSGQSDEFTRKVAELFAGQIEENER
jgi:DNA polymerase-3 subunit gamma/tau